MLVEVHGDRQGRFKFPPVPAGKYKLRVEAEDGFYLVEQVTLTSSTSAPTCKRPLYLYLNLPAMSCGGFATFDKPEKVLPYPIPKGK